MKPFISYTDLKHKYLLQVINLRIEVDHITPKKVQLFEEYDTVPAKVNARFFVILIRHGQIETISDGNIIIEVKVV